MFITRILLRKRKIKKLKKDFLHIIQTKSLCKENIKIIEQGLKIIPIKWFNRNFSTNFQQKPKSTKEFLEKIYY